VGGLYLVVVRSRSCRAEEIQFELEFEFESGMFLRFLSKAAISHHQAITSFFIILGIVDDRSFDNITISAFNTL
jgi:hypothetical protein